MSGDADGGRGGLIRRMRRWQNAIGAADITRSEAALCNAYLPFIDVHTGEAYPSMSTLACYSKMDERTVKAAWRSLRGKGVLTVVSESKGGNRHGRGISHRIRLELDALEALAVEERGEQPPQTAGGTTPGALQRNPHSWSNTTPPRDAPTTPANRGEEPSIHTPPEEPPMRTTQPEGMAVQPLGGWMDGRVRDALEAAGIRGPNLEALANAPGLTLAEVRREWDSIARAKGVRSPAAVLFKRLAKRHGVECSARGPMDAGMLAAIGELERMRRQRRA